MQWIQRKNQEKNLSIILTSAPAIDHIHGQYRKLQIQNKALFFAQLENIHDQTIKYLRHYIEIEFIRKRIDYGFDQFNTFLRMVFDKVDCKIKPNT